MKTINITVTGMSCGHCSAAVKKSIESVRGVKSADVDLVSGRVTVNADLKVSEADITAAVLAAGYDIA